MDAFFKWVNRPGEEDPLLKAAIAHLWFVTLHPFDDGNGRIARAIADMQLARADGIRDRFYSMSNQIRQERNAYYDVLETTQKGGLDITGWLQWFLSCLGKAIDGAGGVLGAVLDKGLKVAREAGAARQARLDARSQALETQALQGVDPVAASVQ